MLELNICLQAKKKTRTYNKKLYIKSDWNPSNASMNVEYRLIRFKQQLKRTPEDIINSTRPSTNTSTVQKYLLGFLRNYPYCIVIDIDKNLGPTIIERETYDQLILKEHLLTETYLQITKEHAQDTLEDPSEDINEFVGFEYKRDLDNAEKLYFGRGLMAKHGILEFYGTAKVHNFFEEEEIPFRPFNSQCRNLSAVISKYVDYYLQKLITSIPSQIRSSGDSADKLKKLKLNSSDIWLTTPDANSIYSFIDPEEVIRTIQK